MTGRDWYRIALLVQLGLLVREIAIVQSERQADDLEPADCTDVLEAHGVEVA